MLVTKNGRFKVVRKKLLPVTFRSTCFPFFLRSRRVSDQTVSDEPCMTTELLCCLTFCLVLSLLDLEMNETLQVSDADALSVCSSLFLVYIPIFMGVATINLHLSNLDVLEDFYNHASLLLLLNLLLNPSCWQHYPIRNNHHYTN